MIPDLDIFRSAQALIKQHGQDAPIHAAMRADAMIEAGDLVKGAYTNSRLRQMIFGGATSHILAEAQLPVLMAH